MTTSTTLKVYYDKDIDTSKLLGKKVAVIGFGSQGHGQILNLKDSGVEVKAGLRIGGASHKKAEAAGLSVVSIEDAVKWAEYMVSLGAGELLVTSMDRDGTKIGFNNPLNRAISDAVDVPIIASGGVGNLQHLVEGIQLGGADAVLAASIFHYGEYTVQQAKAYMQAHNIEVRL